MIRYLGERNYFDPTTRLCEPFVSCDLQTEFLSVRLNRCLPLAPDVGGVVNVSIVPEETSLEVGNQDQGDIISLFIDGTGSSNVSGDPCHCGHGTLDAEASALVGACICQCNAGWQTLKRQQGQWAWCSQREGADHTGLGDRPTGAPWLFALIFLPPLLCCGACCLRLWGCLSKSCAYTVLVSPCLGLYHLLLGDRNKTVRSETVSPGVSAPRTRKLSHRRSGARESLAATPPPARSESDTESSELASEQSASGSELASEQSASGSETEEDRGGPEAESALAEVGPSRFVAQLLAARPARGLRVDSSSV